MVITQATDASKLLKKPELKRPERPETPKKLFDQQEQQQQHQPGTAAAPAAAAAAAAAPEHAVAGWVVLSVLSRGLETPVLDTGFMLPNCSDSVAAMAGSTVLVGAHAIPTCAHVA